MQRIPFIFYSFYFAWTHVHHNDHWQNSVRQFYFNLWKCLWLSNGNVMQFIEPNACKHALVAGCCDCIIITLGSKFHGPRPSQLNEYSHRIFYYCLHFRWIYYFLSLSIHSIILPVGAHISIRSSRLSCIPFSFSRNKNIRNSKKKKFGSDGMKSKTESQPGEH